MGKKDDNELLEIVNEIFSDFEKDKKQIQKKKTQEISEDDFKRALRYTQNELDELYEAFVKFQNEIKDLKVKDFLLNELMEFGSKAEFIETIVRGKFKQNQNSKAARQEYEKLQKLRAKILTDIYDYYEKGMPF